MPLHASAPRPSYIGAVPGRQTRTTSLFADALRSFTKRTIEACGGGSNDPCMIKRDERLGLEPSEIAKLPTLCLMNSGTIRGNVDMEGPSLCARRIVV